VGTECTMEFPRSKIISVKNGSKISDFRIELLAGPQHTFDYFHTGFQQPSMFSNNALLSNELYIPYGRPYDQIQPHSPIQDQQGSFRMSLPESGLSMASLSPSFTFPTSPHINTTFSQIPAALSFPISVSAGDPLSHVQDQLTYGAGGNGIGLSLWDQSNASVEEDTQGCYYESTDGVEGSTNAQGSENEGRRMA
jgi:hypothetical protein